MQQLMNSKITHDELIQFNWRILYFLVEAADLMPSPQFFSGLLFPFSSKSFLIATNSTRDPPLIHSLKLGSEAGRNLDPKFGICEWLHGHDV